VKGLKAEYSEDIFKFEELRRYSFCVAVAPGHPFARLEAVPLEKLAAEPMVSIAATIRSIFEF